MSGTIAIKSYQIRKMSEHNGFMSNAQLYEECPFLLRDIAAG